MAEAGGTTTTQPAPPRFFCYKCSQEISHVLEDFTCPICKGGFIEEVQEPRPTESSAGSQNPVGGGHGHGAAFDMGGGGFDFLQLLRGFSDPTGGGGATVRFSSGPRAPNFQRARSEGSGATSPGNSHNVSFYVGPSRGPGGHGQSNPDLENPMEHMLFVFLNDLINSLGGGAAAGGAPVLSNFGDYAWGRDGLDAIVTQLMDQMEGTGPPPLATENIETLPDIHVKQEQVDAKLQCSVCWDDFKLDEVVKKLECDHLYHPDCIIPWLKLHGTCPICRKDLSGQVHQDPSAALNLSPDSSNVDRASMSQSNSAETSNRSSNPSRPASETNRMGNSGPFGRNLPSSAPGTPTATNPFQQLPVTNLISQILDPLLTGVAGAGSVNQPGSGRDGSSRQQPRSQDRRGPGRDFDNMDLDFD